ncbi:MAG: LPS export ABC transporter periplasmic protein LptC, partial [Bacteroidia bacterium]|nr:LPS export ABC transporter periplasmic protein LptC [Bacteroidia bacterium]
VFYNPDKSVQSTLTAGHAIYKEKLELWEASENVVVVNQNGDIINSEKMFWDRKKGKIYSDEFVKITTKDEIIYGNGFEAGQSLNNWVIKQITGTVNLKET